MIEGRFGEGSDVNRSSLLFLVSLGEVVSEAKVLVKDWRALREVLFAEDSLEDADRLRSRKAGECLERG